MESIPISKFKATCLAVLEEVNSSGRPILVTRFGKPVAEIIRPRVEGKPPRVAGLMAHTGRILGDIVTPISPESEWNALR